MYLLIYAQNSMQMWSSESFQIHFFSKAKFIYLFFAQNELLQFIYNTKLMYMWNTVLCSMPFFYISKCTCLVIIMCVKTCCWLQGGNKRKNQVTWSSSNHMQVLQYGQVAEPEASGDPASPLYSQALAHNELIMHPPKWTLPFQCTHFDKLQLASCFYAHKSMQRSNKQQNK